MLRDIMMITIQCIMNYHSAVLMQYIVHIKFVFVSALMQLSALIRYYFKIWHYKYGANAVFCHVTHMWLYALVSERILTKSTQCHVWCLQILWKWRYSVFILLRDVMWLRDQRDIWLDKWELLTIIHHPTKFGGSRTCGSRNIMIWICLVTQQKSTF